MGLREWVIVLAVILMIVVAADAWRRVKRQRRYHGNWVRPGSGASAYRGDSTSEVRVSRVSGDKPRAKQSARPTKGLQGDARRTPPTDSRLAAGRAVTTGHHDADPAPYDYPAQEADSLNAEWPEDAVTAAPGKDGRDHREFRESGADTGASAGGRYAPGSARKPLDLSQKVPMLVDSVDTEDESPESDAPEVPENQFEFDLQPPEPEEHIAHSSSTAEAHYEPDDYDPDDVLMSGSRGATKSAAPSDYPSDSDADDSVRANDDPFADLYDEPTAWEQTLQDDMPPVPTSVEDDDQFDETDDEIQDPALDAADSRQLADEEAGEQLLTEPEEVLVITVLAREGVEFEGANLLPIMLACGMRFGRMNIFHATDDHGRLQYSAANAYNPGTFDLDDLNNFSTRGVTFFLQLPCQSNPQEAFEEMVHAANTLATHMDGDVVDESRSVMTAQTLTHYRERIRDHQRAQLVKRA